jgi:uncharacterized membrane protein YhaH (DUF805 family)
VAGGAGFSTRLGLILYGPLTESDLKKNKRADMPALNVIQEYFINIFRYKYFQYKGRARRREYWLFCLFSGICSFIFGLIPILGLIYNLAALVPHCCLGIRRLHDIGKSGWWLLLSPAACLGLVGFMTNPEAGFDLMFWLGLAICLILVFFFCQDSQPGESKYGPNPKGS